MRERFSAWFIVLKQFVLGHRKAVIGAGAGLMVLVLLACTVPYWVISPSGKYVLDDRAAIRDKNIAVGLVLGAGVRQDGTPYRELQARLDKAAEALREGYVTALIVSGDNRFSHYDEPTAMKRYLTDVQDIDPDKVHMDYAGRSTYESCERAAKIFQLQEVLLISAPSHLPRAIYLCRHFDVQAYGLASDAAYEANNAGRREVLARAKALWNVYGLGEPTVLGEPVSL